MAKDHRLRVIGATQFCPACLSDIPLGKASCIVCGGYMRAHNLVVGDCPDDVVALFFGNIPAEGTRWDFPVKRLDAKVRWSAILRDIGVFESGGEASKAGWNKPVEPGWQDFLVGNRPRMARVCILRYIPFEPEAEE